MTTEAVFIVSKQPFGSRYDGETTISRLLISAAAEVCGVTVVAFAEETAGGSTPVRVIEVPKSPLRWGPLLAKSIVQRRSLIHTRFSPKGLRVVLEAIPSDVIVARRVYMAQAAIDAGRIPPRDRLVVLVDALESMVMKLRSSRMRPLLKLESARTRRDELRCIRSASELACFSDAEVDELEGEISVQRRLNLVLPPARTRAPLEHPLAAFVGDRTWEPNADALRRLMHLWPKIRAAVPWARLVVVGRPGPGERRWQDPDIEVTGFVPDIDAIWHRAGVLLAPVAIGGGVRVKVLDAARNGVPVVGSTAAVGSCSRYLPIVASNCSEEFCSAAISILQDSVLRRKQGSDLYEANRTLAFDGYVQKQLEELLSGQNHGGTERVHPHLDAVSRQRAEFSSLSGSRGPLSGGS